MMFENTMLAIKLFGVSFVFSDGVAMILIVAISGSSFIGVLSMLMTFQPEES